MGQEETDKLQDNATVKKYAKFLHATIPLKEAVQLSKRVNYFRGNKLIEVLLDPNVKNVAKPVCETPEDAKNVGLALLRNGFIHASKVGNKKKRELLPIPSAAAFEEEGYYTWIYEGSNTMRNLMLALLVFSIAAMCLYPIWPAKAKIGIWYISVTLLIFLFVLFTVRLIVYIIFWSIGFEFWILPNFFDEDLGVMDSFRPLISFGKAEDLKETWIFRGAGFTLLLAFCYWCYLQPTEFDELYAQQMDFLSELYDGKLLSDQAFTDQEAAEKRIPKIEELEKAILEEEESVEEEQVEDVDDDDANEDEALKAALEKDEEEGEQEQEEELDI